MDAIHVENLAILQEISQTEDYATDAVKVDTNLERERYQWQ